MIPVTPAAHYHMGGIAVDATGRSSVDGMWVCGEAAATGVHGANRLASNSLLEGLVFGRRVANDIVAYLEQLGAGTRRAPAIAPLAARAAAASPELRRLMFERVGVVRDAVGLGRALDEIDHMQRAGTDDSARLNVARLIARAALDRPESRGSHFRTDHPHPSAAFARRSFVTPAAA